MIERIVNTATPAADPVEEEFELKLRPHDFANYIGQDRLKQNLQLAITAAKKRGEPLDHVLGFAGDAELTLEMHRRSGDRAKQRRFAGNAVIHLAVRVAESGRRDADVDQIKSAFAQALSHDAVVVGDQYPDLHVSTERAR